MQNITEQKTLEMPKYITYTERLNEIYNSDGTLKQNEIKTDTYDSTEIENEEIKEQ